MEATATPAAVWKPRVQTGVRAAWLAGTPAHQEARDRPSSPCAGLIVSHSCFQDRAEVSAHAFIISSELGHRDDVIPGLSRQRRTRGFYNCSNGPPSLPPFPQLFSLLPLFFLFTSCVLLRSACVNQTAHQTSRRLLATHRSSSSVMSMK